MKGGKQGRPRRAGAGDKAKGSGRGAVKKGSGNSKRQGSVAPKKGERNRTFGGRSSSDEA